MADGTRMCLLDDSIKNLEESSTAQNQRLDEQHLLLSEVIVRLAAIEGCLEQTNRVSSSSPTGIEAIVVRDNCIEGVKKALETEDYEAAIPNHCNWSEIPAGSFAVLSMASGVPVMKKLQTKA
ncbi:hypothetical protein NE237_026479 [Protea cynaroides]|uniref:Uncharacterized protein n=1 Tax=Protea cynaroides TaxID=273540 RepID=A0A9Q0H4B3_9MAGN|nr:hypothetical protein NE237_026479 [Protea cynaroides]